jgi:DDE superfamily endonuclease/Helix-turn-helix of DDE superfamily endonuclease
MIFRHWRLSRYPTIFRAMTGLSVADFATLFADLQAAFAAAEVARHSRPDRQRAIGGGGQFEFKPRDQLLCTVVWLRQYPTNEALAYFFGVSDSTVSRAIARWLPLLEQAGKDTFRLPDPGRKHRRPVETVLADQPALLVLVDTFEQPVQRATDRAEADRHYSGKKKDHTLKSQVGIDELTGTIVDVADSVPGPTADITLLKGSTLAGRLPAGVGLGGDLAYVGADKLHPQGLVATPRRKPRGQERPAADIEYNRAFARRRVAVEHTIGLMRRYQAITHGDRHHRKHHTARVRAIAGLVNRRLQRWVAYRLRQAA